MESSYREPIAEHRLISLPEAKLLYKLISLKSISAYRLCFLKSMPAHRLYLHTVNLHMSSQVDACASAVIFLIIFFLLLADSEIGPHILLSIISSLIILRSGGQNKDSRNASEFLQPDQTLIIL